MGFDAARSVMLLKACACWACAVAGSQPLLAIPSRSIKRCMISSCMTNRCSKTASRVSSFAEQQCTYERPVGLCSTIAAAILREEVLPKVIISR